jgi:hypothetical protein
VKGAKVIECTASLKCPHETETAQSPKRMKRKKRKKKKEKRKLNKTLLKPLPP